MNELIKDISEWFPKLPEKIQASLLEHPEQKITGDTYQAIFTARNYGVPIVGWVDVPGSEAAHLNPEEQDWLREHA